MKRKHNKIITCGLCLTLALAATACGSETEPEASVSSTVESVEPVESAAPESSEPEPSAESEAVVESSVEPEEPAAPIDGFAIDPEYVPMGWTSQVDSGWVLGELSKTATINYNDSDSFYSINYAEAGFVDKVYIGFGEDLDLTDLSSITVHLKGVPESFCVKAANKSWTNNDFEWMTHENESGDHYPVSGVASEEYPGYTAYTLDVSGYSSEKIGGLLIGDFTISDTVIEVGLSIDTAAGNLFAMDPEYIATGWTSQVDSGWVLGELSKNATPVYNEGDKFYNIQYTEAGFVDKVYIGFGESLSLDGVSSITVHMKGVPESFCIKAVNPSWTGTEYEWLTHETESGEHLPVTGAASTAYPGYTAYTIDVSAYASENIGGLLIGDFTLEGTNIEVATTISYTMAE